MAAPSLLVVEDHEELRVAIEELLTAAGYVVRSAADVSEAMVVLETMPRPCLVLWDPVSHRMSLSLPTQAGLHGIHVATIPVDIAPSQGAMSGSFPGFTKRLTSNHALLSIVKEYCPEL